MILRTIILLLSLLFCQVQDARQIVICFVLDQCSYDSLFALRSRFTGGIKFLLDHGTVYHNAYWPHAIPSTSPGHTGLATGCLPKEHGIIDNDWIDALGNKVAADDDSTEKAAVFSDHGTYSFGKSGANIMVDSISDQLILQSDQTKKNVVFSVGYKDRASIMMSGKLGKALWVDGLTGNFTTSKAYFSELPTFIENFNQAHPEHKESFIWKPLSENKPNSSSNFARQESPFNKLITIHDQKNAGSYFERFRQTPASQQLVLELAKDLLHKSINDQNEIILLWIGLGATDKVGHIYGPDSIEYKDILLQTDLLLKNFMDEIASLDSEKILYVLTADHGSMPIAEHLNEKKFGMAKRVNTKELKKNLNLYLEKKYNINKVIRRIDTPSIYLNRTELAEVSKNRKQRILLSIKRWLKRQTGIKQVWTYDELKTKCVTANIEQLFKNHLFAGRSGDLFFLVYPYVYASKNIAGTGHKSPYNYDTHVPLIMYRPTQSEPKQIYQKVWVQQVAPTLAQLLKVPKPSACTFNFLPGIDLN